MRRDIFNFDSFLELVDSPLLFMARCRCHEAMAGCWVFRSFTSNHYLTSAHAFNHIIVHSCMSHKCSIASACKCTHSGHDVHIHMRAAQDRLDTRKILW